MLDLDIFMTIANKKHTSVVLLNNEQEIPCDIDVTNETVRFINKSGETELTMTEEELSLAEVVHDSHLITLNDKFLLALYEVTPIYL